MTEPTRFPPTNRLCEYCGHIIGLMDHVINAPRMPKLNPQWFTSTEVDLSPVFDLDRYHSWCWEAKRQGRSYDKREGGPA